ncbi:MAG: ATPase, T2SS/T4P/T4SS family, partial [Polyangiales bacterium]
MAGIDSILALLVRQDGNELRVASGVEPKMFASGIARRIAIPVTSDETLRDLLGELWNAERAAIVREGRRVEIDYEAPKVGVFHVVFAPHANGFQATFRKQGKVTHAVSVPTASASTPTESAAPIEEPVVQPIEAPELRVARVRDRPLEPSGLSALIERVAPMRASDLHLAEAAHPTVRIDGALSTLTDVMTHDLPQMLALSATQREALAEGRSIDASLEVASTIRARLHVYATSTGLCAAVRLLPTESPSIAQLQLGDALDPLIDLPNGLILICGSAGSGKSTTLAALAQEILRRRSVVMVTLEDPIELPLVATEQSV